MSNTLPHGRADGTMPGEQGYQGSEGQASPLFAGMSRAISPSATRPLDLSALAAHA